jgi:hypothetical protein
MVGHGDRRHLLLDDYIHQLPDLAGPIEQGVIGMAVKMDERIFRHGLSWSLGRRFHCNAKNC